MQFIDSHCHINIIVKNQFDVPLTTTEIETAKEECVRAAEIDVTKIINVGTSLVESQNCVILAQKISQCYAAIGIHPSDCTPNWRKELQQMRQSWFLDKEYFKKYKIVAIGECGLDYYRPGFNKQLQYDAFKAQIELALEYDLALIIHTRAARDETLRVVDDYKNQGLRGVIHCFSENQTFAEDAIELGFVLGIGGTLTYPKNDTLRSVFANIPLEKIILETDAPYLPLQEMRGKKNHPVFIPRIAAYLATLRNEPLATVAEIIYATTEQLFKI